MAIKILLRRMGYCWVGVALLMFLAALPAVEAANLTIQVYRTGTWSAGQGDWIKGADVAIRDLRKGRTYTRKTDGFGKAVFPSMNVGQLSLAVRKTGCGEVRQTLQMVRSNTTKNIELGCQASRGVHKLTLIAVDAGAKSCGVNRLLSGQQVKLYEVRLGGSSANPVRVGTTNRQGVVTFSIPPGRYQASSGDTQGCFMRNRVDVQMPARRHRATLQVQCSPQSYTLEAQAAVSGAVPRAGGNLTLSMVVKNLGSGQPSYPVKMWMSKRPKTGPVNVWGLAGDYLQTFSVDALCAGETGVASVVDRNVKPGVWVYRVGIREARSYPQVGHRSPEIEVNIMPATPRLPRLR